MIEIIENNHVSEKGGGTMTNLHYIADEQLGGVEREYAEVEREPVFGDLVIYDGKVREVTYVGLTAMSLDARIHVDINDMPTLKPTGNVRIDGTVYRMVERKAAVGEKVLVTEIDHCEVSEIRNVVELDSDYFGVFYLDKPIDDWDYIDMTTDKYHVLEPKEIFTCTYDPSKAIIAGNPPADDITLTESDVRNKPRQVIDLIANLAGRLSKLESKVERLGTANQQAYDILARNVETWAQDFEEFKAQQSTASDLKLDSIERERESTGRNTVSISFYGNPTAKELAEKLSDVFAGTLTAEERREL